MTALKDITVNSWRSMDSAPKDGTWIKARGYNYGEPSNGRHSVIAFFENGQWFSIGFAREVLFYLDEWQPLCNH